MIPDPLHPAVVHFPIVLAALLPLAAIVALILIARGAPAQKTWSFVVALSVMLALASWAAVETGQDEEDTVEKVVAEEPIHEHEEAGERMLIFSGIGVVLVGLGLANGKIGQVGRWIGTIAAVGLVGASYQVGRLGGELVYQHGAASAYTDSLPGQGVGTPRSETDDD